MEVANSCIMNNILSICSEALQLRIHKLFYQLKSKKVYFSFFWFIVVLFRYILIIIDKFI